MARYYFSLLSVNLLIVKLSLKLHMNIVQNLLLTTISSLFIRTFKVSSYFFNLLLNTLFFLNFFSCYLFVHILFIVEKMVSLVYHFRVLSSSITLCFTIYIYIYKARINFIYSQGVASLPC